MKIFFECVHTMMSSLLYNSKICIVIVTVFKENTDLKKLFCPLQGFRKVGAHHTARLFYDPFYCIIFARFWRPFWGVKGSRFRWHLKVSQWPEGWYEGLKIRSLLTSCGMVILRLLIWACTCSSCMSRSPSVYSTTDQCNIHETSEPVFVNFLRSPGIDSQPGGPAQQTLFAGPAARRQHTVGRNRFLGFINVYKYGLRYKSNFIFVNFLTVNYMELFVFSFVVLEMIRASTAFFLCCIASCRTKTDQDQCRTFATFLAPLCSHLFTTCKG